MEKSERGSLTLKEALEAVKEEHHVSCILLSAHANAQKFDEMSKLFLGLESFAIEVSDDAYDTAAETLDAYAGYLLAASDRIRELGGLTTKNTPPPL